MSHNLSLDLPPSSTHTIFQVPSLVTPEIIQAYSSIRLRSLQVDGPAFGSSHAREAAFTEEEWKERLSSGRGYKATFIAAEREDQSVHNTKVSNESQREGPGGTWVGCVTVLGPEALKDIPPYRHLVSSTEGKASEHPGDSGPPKGSGNRDFPYVVVAAWVAPEARRQGLGRQLLDAALEWVKNDEPLQPQDPTGEALAGQARGASPSSTPRTVMLRVYTWNTAAIGLYENAGFKVDTTLDEEVDTGTGGTEVWMVYPCQ